MPVKVRLKYHVIWQRQSWLGSGMNLFFTLGLSIREHLFHQFVLSVCYVSVGNEYGSSFLNQSCVLYGGTAFPWRVILFEEIIICQYL